MIAYGGDSLPSYRADEATHIFYPDADCRKLEDAAEGARHLDVAFLVDSLKLRRVPEEDAAYRM